MRAWEVLVGRQAAPIVEMSGDDLSSNKEACLAGGAPAARLVVPVHECVVSACSWCKHDGVCAEADQAGGAGRLVNRLCCPSTDATEIGTFC